MRKATYRLYPTPAQKVALGDLLRSHQQLYNAALEERISAWQKLRKSISYADQCKSLTDIRRCLPEYAIPNCSSQQMTLRRLNRAFSAFFGRVKRGEAPGFPRFKSLSGFPGISFKGHGDGWRFTPEDKWKHGCLRLSGVGQMRCRGRARQGGDIRASDLCFRDGEWFLSLSLEEEKTVRPRCGDGAIALDWGVDTLLTGITDKDEVVLVENPRLYQKGKEHINALARSVSRKKRGSKRRKRAVRRLSRARGREARVRLDQLHKLTCTLARNYAMVGMEELAVKAMTQKKKGKVGGADEVQNSGMGTAQKAGLNREILDTAPAKLMSQLRYKDGMDTSLPPGMVAR